MKSYKNTKRVFIIHGYKSYPKDCWFPWLKRELTKKGVKVSVPCLPNPAKPHMKQWVTTIKKIVDTPDEQTVFVGHSLGVIAILRYLETLKQSQKVGGVISVGGRVIKTPKRKQTSSFFAKPIAWHRIRKRAKHFVAIYSKNDDVVSFENGKVFQKKLRARLIVEDKYHFDRERGIFKLPSVKREISDIFNKLSYKI